MLEDIKKKINFKHPKYIVPLPFYPLLLFIGHTVVDFSNISKKNEEESSLEQMEEINPHMARGYGNDIISKREGIRDAFDDLVDHTAIQGIEDDKDSLNRKEEYKSQYSDAEQERLEKEARRAELQRQRDAINQQARDGRDQSPEEFLGTTSREGTHKGTPQEIQDEIEMARRLGINNARALAKQYGVDLPGEEESDNSPQSIISSEENISESSADSSGKKSVKGLDSNGKEHTVFKKLPYRNSSFNTIGDNQRQTNVIKAIIDENIKAVDGSRVRLRLLDDIEVDDVTIKKGSYLYCTMSGFGSQRVKGKVESVMVGDEIYKISLSVYDTDGLEGLYVPESSFRETSKEIGTNALGGGMSVNDGMKTSNSIAQWASQAVQQTYSSISNALSKHVGKNKACLKYGTQVLLLNGNTNNSGNKKK